MLNTEENRSVPAILISFEPVRGFYMIKTRLIREMGDQKLGQILHWSTHFNSSVSCEMFSFNFWSNDIQLIGILVVWLGTATVSSIGKKYNVPGHYNTVWTQGLSWNHNIM